MEILCKKCNLFKLDSFFYRNKKTKNGLSPACKECTLTQVKNYYQKNKVKVKSRVNKWVEDNKEYRRKYYKDWVKNNKEHINKYTRKYFKNRIENDLLFKIKIEIKRVMHNSLRGLKDKSTIEILGCSIEEFKNHLESKFEPWMSWENRGKYNGEFNFGWDIDHIIPSREAKNKEDLIRLNHYMNLQPLCSKINREIKR